MQQWANNGAGPIQVNRFNKAWRSLDCEHCTCVELRGTIGVEERSSTLMMIGDRTKREDVTKSQEAIGKIFDWTLTKQNTVLVVNEIEKAKAEAKTRRPVKDERKTQEQVTADNAKYLQLDEERKLKDATEKAQWIALYGTGETATAQSGQMCLVAQLCFDNSDVQSDYFDSHATLSPAYALLIISEQRRTESLARHAASLSPLLQGVEFSWHVENYSMGHGNYLQSKGFELPDDLKGVRNIYGGDGVQRGHWEIKFCGKGEYPAFQGFRTSSIIVPAESTSSSVGSVSVRENAALGGIELHFSGKPDDTTVSRLKGHGWRWKRGTNHWYKKASDQARAFANEMAA